MERISKIKNNPRVCCMIWFGIRRLGYVFQFLKVDLVTFTFIRKYSGTKDS